MSNEGRAKVTPMDQLLAGPDPVTTLPERYVDLNILLHQALGVEPCVSVCTHVVAGEWTILGIANVVKRTGERIRDLEAEVEEAHLARIAAQNPGIDIEQVRRERRAALEESDQ